MTSWTPPTDEQLAGIETLAARPENRAYFFDRLENPEWLAALAQRGFFEEPPEPVPADEPGYLRFPPWPEGRYLARVASVVPDATLSVLEAQSHSSNPTVTRTLLEAAEELPDEHLQRLASRIVEWIADPFPEFFVDEAVSLVVRLVRAGEINHALGAAMALLKLESQSDRAEASPRDASPALRVKPTSRLSEWQYGSVISKVLADLVETGGLKAMELFSSLLDDALEFSRREGEAPDSDSHSFTWRPAIEDHGQNSERGFRSILVSAVRDAAVRLALSGESELETTVLFLESGTVLHRRTALHVIANATGGSQLAADRVADRRLFDDYRLKHEYAALVRSRFGDAPLEVQQTFLGWVLAGPDVEEFREGRSSFDGTVPTHDEEAAYVGIWQRDWLSFVGGHLSGEVAGFHRELVETFGEPEHPDFLSWTSSWTGPESPVTTNEMTSWSPAEVIGYLVRWHPDDASGWHPGPSVEGLGRAFKDVVASRAVEFVDVADEVIELDPTYVRGFLGGIETAVRDGVSIEWDQLLRLMSSVVEHFFEHDEEVPDLDRDPGLRWTRREVASLIRAGLADRDNQIPFEMRERVWQVLEPLSSDPNPSPAHEATYGGDNMGPFTLSINTNRGSAMHGIVEYSLWCRRQLAARGVDVEAGFDLVSEARDVLQDHLDPDSEPSLAIRSVYGRWLPWLLLLDERWVAENIANIFPPIPELTAFRDAAWDSYIGWCPPYDSVYEALGAEYAAAVERVPSEATVGLAHEDRSNEKLGEHLVTFFWRDVVQRPLLDRWFELGNDELAGHAMDFIGRALEHTEGEVPRSVQRRIEDLWNRRLEAIQIESGAHEREAGAFASTFASGKLDEAWSLAGLEVAVQSAGVTWRGGGVIARLVEVAAATPAVATRLTLALLHGSRNDWDHVGWREEVRSMLSVTSDSLDEETLENRSAIVDFYVSRGELDFRPLI